MKNFGKLSCEFGAYFNQKLVINLPTSYCTKGDHYYILRRSVQNLGIMVLRSRAAVWFFSLEKKGNISTMKRFDRITSDLETFLNFHRTIVCC